MAAYVRAEGGGSEVALGQRATTRALWPAALAAAGLAVLLAGLAKPFDAKAPVGAETPPSLLAD